jgi:hypothetical protein
MQINIYSRKKIRGTSPYYEIEQNPSYSGTPPSDRTGSRKYTTENIVQITHPSQQSADEARWEDDGGETE